MDKGVLKLVKVEGFYYRFSEEEQFNYICKVMSDFFRKQESVYGSVENFAKSFGNSRSMIINLEYKDEVEKKNEESDSIKDKYINLKNQVKNDRDMFNDTYVDNDKSLRLK